MRMAIVGSRNLEAFGKEHAPDILRNAANIILRLYVGLPDKPTLISGGAAGIDSLAEGIAKAIGYPSIIFKPEWDKHGKSAGFKRNQKIVDTADRILAISINGSSGTADTVKRAQDAGKPVTLITITVAANGLVTYTEVSFNA